VISACPKTIMAIGARANSRAVSAIESPKPSQSDSLHAPPRGVHELRTIEEAKPIKEVKWKLFCIFHVSPLP
jgi:hypothetical protein